MRDKMIKFWNLVIKFINWYMKRNRLGVANGPFLTICVYFGIGAIIDFFDFIPSKFLSKIAVILFMTMLIIVSFIADSKFVRKITKGQFTTPIELLKNFSNKSYLYGVLFWIFSIEVITYSMINILIDIELPWNEYTIINVMLFTFLWFTYHLYMNNELGNEEQKPIIIKLKLQFYGVIASTISALFLIFDSWQEFKIMVAMLALVFSWLRYIIDVETQKIKIKS